MYLLLGIIACGTGRPENQNNVDRFVSEQTDSEPDNLILSITAVPDKIVQGDPVTITFKGFKGTEPDSVVLFIGQERVGQPDKDLTWTIQTSAETMVGNTTLKAVAYKGKNKQTRKFSMLVFPADLPTLYKAKVVRVLPHSEKNYTQGLTFYKGNLIEGTGEYKLSSLQLLEFPQMKELKRVDLDDRYFGEGITVLNDKIYQLTWKERKLFIYDAQTFQKEREIAYPREGWGLTDDGQSLYASDGTEFIYKIDPSTMETVDRIQVMCADKQVIRNINELEWIDGKIWANVYGSEQILIIHPGTGVVTGVIDASGLLENNDIKPYTDVLNGIAFNPVTGKIYITGKNWPKLFEIELQEVR